MGNGWLDYDSPSSKLSTSIGTVEGKITKITGAGVFYAVKVFDETLDWGPATLPVQTMLPAGTPAHVHAMAGPTVGNRVLVAMPVGDTGQGWVVAWAP